MNKKAQMQMVFLLIIGVVVFLLLTNKGNDGESTQGGIELYLTDKGVDDITELQLRIQQIEIINTQNRARNIYSGDMAVSLKEQLMQKIAGNLLPGGTYTRLRIRFSGESSAKLNDGTTEQVRVNSPQWEIIIDETIIDGENLVIVMDLPLEDAVDVDDVTGEIEFDPCTPFLQIMKKQLVRERVRERVGQKFIGVDTDDDGITELEEIELKMEMLRQEEQMQNENQVNCPTYEEPLCENGQIISPGKLGECDLPPICKIQARNKKW